ncbi:MAG: LPS translocon maturation chaperone LptM [Methylophilaceae bacterium]
MMRKTLIYAFLIAAYVALFGCGTTGPLYIPEQRYPQEVESDMPPDATDITQPEQTPNN